MKQYMDGDVVVIESDTFIIKYPMVLEQGDRTSEYLGQRVIENDFDYPFVITKRPDLKVGIDEYLISKGREDLITQ